MILAFTPEEYNSIVSYPLPWWAQEPRNALGRLAGIPGAIVDENDNITGYAINHASIDSKDLFLLEILRAGWAYIADMTDAEQAALQTLQMQNDWNAWYAAKARLDDENDNYTAEQLEADVWAYVESVANTLGLSYTPPVEPTPS